MISIYKKQNSTTSGNEKEIEVRELSTDTKPLELNGKSIPNGSVLIEIDTGSVFVFDEDNQEWNEV